MPGTDRRDVGAGGRLADMTFVERALTFACGGEHLVGILAEPAVPAKLGVVVVVGGPQYRVGSHRQFVLFARRLATAGIAVLRFDCRGMGDATGPALDFERSADDISAGVDVLIRACPGLKTVVLFGLCDAASAVLLYLEQNHDTRVGGIVLLNPWVRSDVTIAKTYLKHYYGRRLLQKAFWTKLFGGSVNVGDALNAIAKSIKSATARPASTNSPAAMTFQDRMAAGMVSFGGSVLVLLSERDLTAKEFMEFAETNSRWTGLLDRINVERHEVPAADHTFSDSGSREMAESHVVGWLLRKFPLDRA